MESSKVKKSTRKTKKLMYEDKNGKIVHFGAKGM